MSMNYDPSAGYPHQDALVSLMLRMGIVSGPMITEGLMNDFAAATSGAVSEWERQTNYFPFWSGGSSAPDSSRTFDAPPVNSQISGASNGGSGGSGWGGVWCGGGGGRNYDLDFEAGLVSLTTALAGVTNYTIGGPAPIQNYLIPQNALSLQKPYQGIRFCTRPAAIGPQSIVITGRWGFCDVLPPDVWNAILGYAAMQVAPYLSILLTGGMVSYEEGGVTEKFMENPYGLAMTQWEQRFRRASVRYKRYPIG